MHWAYRFVGAERGRDAARVLKDHDHDGWEVVSVIRDGNDYEFLVRRPITTERGDTELVGRDPWPGPELPLDE